MFVYHFVIKKKKLIVLENMAILFSISLEGGLMGLTGILRDIAVIIGIVIAIYNINSWRREHIGKRKIELAEDTLTLFYEAVDVIHYLRCPGGFTSETEDIKQMNGESEVAYQARKNASVLLKRYNEHQELFSRIHAMRYRFMVQIGKEEAKSFDELRKIIIELITSVRRLSRLWAAPTSRTEEQWTKHQQDVEKYESIFWEGLTENDPINLRVKKVLLDIERICHKTIRQ
jgi:hypothetical protein